MWIGVGVYPLQAGGSEQTHEHWNETEETNDTRCQGALQWVRVIAPDTVQKWEYNTLTCLRWTADTLQAPRAAHSTRPKGCKQVEITVR